MPLLSLPNEVILIIAENLKRTKDVSSFLLTNRRLASLLTPHLHNLAVLDRNGLNALTWATVKGHEELIKFLVLKKGVDINALDKLCGQPALLYAINRRVNFGVRRLLVDLGADIFVDSRGGRKSLHQVASIGCEETMKLFIGKGACPNSLDGEGYTVLYRAVLGSSLSMVNFLLNNGADVNMRNRDGKTALYGAAQGGFRLGPLAERVISLLLRNGADASIRSNAGRTPYQFAEQMNYYRVAGLLKAASENV